MTSPALVAKYDQYKRTANEQIDAMVDMWRSEFAAGKTDFAIFSAQIAAIDTAQPSFERLAVILAFAVERLAQAGDDR